MRKIFLSLAVMSVVFTACVTNDPYVEPKGSELYGNLFLNEVNGTGGASQSDAEKYVELYNKTDVSISLKDFVVEYGGKETWRGRAEDAVPARGYKLIKGAKATYPGMSQGLSSRNANVNLTLLDADGNVVDYYEKAEDLNGKPLESMNHMRIPDGGKWYFTDISAQSPGAANLTNSADPAVKGEMPSMEKTLKIEEITVTPAKPTPDEDVVLTAKVTDVNEIKSVVLKWKLADADQPEKAMAKDGNLYSTTFPKQADGGVVEWTVSATNSKNKTVSESGTIKWEAKKADYTKLKINEVNGVGKWFEIYNTGDVPISLEGVTAHYSNKEPATYTLTWTGNASVTIPAKGYVTTPTGDAGASLGTGLSANNANVRLQLKAPDGTVLDTYEKLLDINNGFDAIKNKSHARIPDGTGVWYYTADNAGTPAATNGTATTGYTKFGEEDGAVTVDYTKLKINEVSGVGQDAEKFYELINTGTIDLKLEGCKLYYNANGATGGTLPTGEGSLTWTGTGAQVAQAGKLFSLIGRNTEGSFTTGLTAGRILIITLKDPDGNVIDRCIRAKDTEEYTFTDKSFARIPDGTGAFYFATPTPNVTNGTSAEGLTAVPQN